MTNPTNGRQNGTPSPEQSRKRSVSYPRFTLEEAEKFALVVFKEGPYRTDPERVAVAADYKGAKNGSFQSLRSTAVNFGLVRTEGGTISVTDQWIEVFNEEDPELHRQARLEAMYAPDLYQQIIADYSDRQLPTQARLERDLYLNAKYGIIKEAAPTAAQVFIQSAKYAGLIDAKGYIQGSGSAPVPVVNDRERDANPSVRTKVEPPIRQAAYVNIPPQPAANATAADPFVTPEGLDRIDIRLSNGVRAYLLVPQPLPYGEKARIKLWVDNLLEEKAPSTNTQTTEPAVSTTERLVVEPALEDG